MAKYNVGDKVLIRATRGSCWNPEGEMDKYCNTVMTIRNNSKLGTDGLYAMEEDKDENCGEGWCWSDDDIVKKVEDETVENKKFKVGDKVRVRSDLVVGEIYHMIGREPWYAGYAVTDDMFKLRGKVVTITEDLDYAYRIAEYEHAWFTDEMFEGLVEETTENNKEDKKMFTKNDLKTGMFGVMSDGQGYFVVVNDTIVYKNGGFDRFSEMTDDMDFDFWKIEKVYENCESFDALEDRINRNRTDGLVYDRERDTKKPLYNGKVVCIDNRHNANNYTIGKIYEFKDGVMTCDCGHIFGKNAPFHNFKDWADYSSAKFIEIVE